MENRVLAAIRLSVKKDETTSPQRQKQSIGTKIASIHGELVGTAEDLNVSASKVEPFSRPQLGNWLNFRKDEFDTIIWWRLDRAIRSMTDLHKLVNWAVENKKQLVFCEGHGSTYDFDYRVGGNKKESSMALMLVTIIAWAAQIESEAISERVTSSHSYLRANGEWGGGVVPYGFVPEPIPGAKRGYRLVHNPETKPVLDGIISRVLDGDRLLPICRDLNKDNVLTPRDWWETFKGREPKGRKWNTPGMKLILQNKALLGEWYYEGRRVVDAEGAPVERGKPLVTVGEFKRIQETLAEFAMDPKVRYEDPNPLLGVARCARCGLPYYLKQEKQKGRVYRSLSCSSRHGDHHKSCGQPTISLRYAMEIAAQGLLLSIGDQEVQRRRFIPGDDRTEERDRIVADIESLEDEKDAGLISDHQRYLFRKKRLIASLAEIGDAPVRKAGYEWTGTGQTYRELWSSLDDLKRRKLFTDLGIQMYIGRGEALAAETAWESQVEYFEHVPTNVRVSQALDENDVSGLLAELQDGSRVKKDFRVWLLQSGDDLPHERLSRIRSSEE